MCMRLLSVTANILISSQHDFRSFSTRLVTKNCQWSTCNCLSTEFKSVEGVGNYLEPLKKAVGLPVGSVGKKCWKKFHKRLEKNCNLLEFFCAPVESVE